MRRSHDYSIPCKFYARGYCARGSACFYSHIKPYSNGSADKVPDKTDPSSDNPILKEHSIVPESSKVCPDYSQGFCAKGPECPLQHVKLSINMV